MASPSISLPDDFLDEVDQRIPGLNRSEYLREALLVRLYLEDADEWERFIDDAADEYDFAEFPSASLSNES